ncbi:MAG TPA: aminoglycoside 6-adenylyltransferase [Candidatus Limnocylindria bacterium]|nr:aminoglycoside 6-adenylyltransferase [Candidatus Limnocylindria bacterium]
MSLPADAPIDRMAAACRSDGRILGLLLYGSRAAGTSDAHSDIDFGVVVADAALADVVADRDSLVRAVGEALFLEDFGNPSNIHVILADGAAFELIVRPIGELVDDGPHRILLDTDGSLARALTVQRAREPQVASAEDVRKQILYFWHEVEHVATAIGREQLLWAHGGLEEMRAICLRLARAAAGADAEDDEPYWKVDGLLYQGLRERLLTTIVPAQSADMRRAAGELLAVYRSLARPLAEQHGLPYPQRLDDLVSARLAAVA